jgi:hypothetical protein
MSGKKQAGRERQLPPDEQGSSDAPFREELRSSPLHLSVAQPPVGGMSLRGSPPMDATARQSMGRSHVSPPQMYLHRPHHGQPPHQPQQYAAGRPVPPGHVTTVTPDSRGLLPHDMRSPPMSASRRRTTGAISTMSASPSKRSRIGEFRFSVSK